MLNIADHFVESTEMVRIGSKAKRPLPSYMLSRYACYLIVQNGDPSKEVIALGQTYFAVKTRQQELIEDYDRLSEEQKRLAIRREMIERNKSLAEAAQTRKSVRPLPSWAELCPKIFLRPKRASSKSSASNVA